MIPTFEENITKLNVGDEFSFGIDADKAYGQRNENAKVDLPHDMFKKDGELVKEIAVGNVLPLEDEGGRVHPAKILSINEETISFDVNHPLAGTNLYFTGTVLESREATAEELDHGHVHGKGGVEH